MKCTEIRVNSKFRDIWNEFISKFNIKKITKKYEKFKV